MPDIRFWRDQLNFGAINIIVLLIILGEIFLPKHVVHAADQVMPLAAKTETIKTANSNFNITPVVRLDQPLTIKKLPQRQVVQTLHVTCTAYSSDPWQTDSTPYITAKQTFVRDGVIAANFLPHGTRVRFPELYGDKEFFVEDRMNKRYWKRIDIWMPEKFMAKQFGVRYLKVEIIK